MAIAGKPCAFCVRPATLAHHDSEIFYRSKKAYYDPKNMTPACGSCHEMYRKGYVICPTCLKQGAYHYMTKGRDECYRHSGTPFKKQRVKYHPCPKNGGSQRCLIPGAVVCNYGKDKVAGCKWYATYSKGVKA